jgi:7-alpha-hydroxysteroid dehydrogenase
VRERFIARRGVAIGGNFNQVNQVREGRRMNKYFSLEGKVAIVTGSGRGIGAGIARKLAEAGAAVSITGRTKSEIEATAAAIRSAGGRAIPIVVDFKDPAQLPGVIERTVAEFGGLDIIVNNAGGGVSPPFVDTRIEGMEAEYRLLVTSPFELTRLALPHLLKRPGASVINILSPGSYKAPRGNLSYYVSKAALAHMTRLMSADLGPRVRVNGIIPGPTETPALLKLFEQRPEIREVAMMSTRMRRLGTPDEIGLGAVYLCSEAGSFITGALLPINGGDIDEPRPISPDL